MAYFLKKTTLKNRTYLAIYESFYNHDKKGTAHKCYKSLGSIETHLKNGIENPIAHFQKEVDDLNKIKNEDGIRKISDKSPILYLGYFLLKSILDRLNIKKYVDYFKLTNDFEYDLYELLSSLVYARSVNPCSKNRTFHEVLPNLYHSSNYSYDQLLDGLSFLGSNYEKFIELFTAQVEGVYGVDTSKTYFDCTNFYFEIDREDDFRRKGPSKENKKNPIVGLGLLLDSHQIPIGMKMYPGNESEKPVLRDVINHLKKQNNITGKTIHVADKGLNCAQNIVFSKTNSDGYLFSKSVKGLSEKEKVWVLLDHDFNEMKDRSGKVLYCYKSCIDKFPYTVEHEGKKVTVNLTEKRLLTYNSTLAAKKRYEINRMVEKAKSLTLSQAKKNDYGETGKYVNFTDSKGNKADVSINQDAIDKDLMFAGYNLLVTSEIEMTDQDMYNTYHNLWRIEESFKIMKSDLDARPVFLQKEDSIKGHFLICYLSVLLERLLQFKILDNKYSTTEIFDFIRGFKATKAESKYINTTTYSDFINDISKIFNLPLTNYFLTETQIKSMFNYKI
ncbi:IS1634 family transposase [Clostridium sp.]|uniref:IS1634 family transposase n=1 Tax=Clostridium sp. TaxID=1506 RepID=UPI002851F446|nr:IS1634 family transposase [Clostridium sp.]MDR3596487.1 IS1634 family transposase [Clostridium sp.]